MTKAILPWLFLLRERQSAAHGDDTRQISQTHEKDRAANFANNKNQIKNSCRIDKPVSGLERGDIRQIAVYIQKSK